MLHPYMAYGETKDKMVSLSLLPHHSKRRLGSSASGRLYCRGHGGDTDAAPGLRSQSHGEEIMSKDGSINQWGVGQ